MISFRYRPAIDGLRAIAVLAVFVFHLNARWLPGGFVGVDVFFVISGYLITSIIARDCETGEFSLTRFYQRRVARIFPVFFVVALSTLLGASLIYTSQDFASTGDSLVATALSVANMKSMMEGTYFEVSLDAKPFLHYWSLSVEEQFYLLFPLFFLLIFKYARKKLVMVLAVICLLSFLLCLLMSLWRPLWAYYLLPNGAFYLLPSRGWQLLAGCILALTTTYDDASQLKRPYHWISMIGLGLIMLSFFVIHKEFHIPGWWALLPTLGAVAVLLPIGAGSSAIEKCLSNQGLVKLGKISYSLYLWHWPIFCLVDYKLYMASEPMRIMLKIGLSIVVSVLSFRFLETPTRLFLNQRKARSLAYSFFVGAVVLCVVIGVGIQKSNYIDASRDDVKNGGLVYDASSSANAETVVLVGDSNGSMYALLLRDVGRGLGQRVVITSTSSADPLPSVTGEQSRYWKDVLEVVKKERPEFLILACNWVWAINEREERFDNAVQSLAPYAKHIIIFNQPPSLPAGATRADIRGGARPPFTEDAAYRLRRLKVNAYLEQALIENAVIIDVATMFETPSGSIPFYDLNGRQIYHDQSHLSSYGAEMARSSLIELFSKLSQQKSEGEKGINDGEKSK